MTCHCIDVTDLHLSEDGKENDNYISVITKEDQSQQLNLCEPVKWHEVNILSYVRLWLMLMGSGLDDSVY